MTHKTDLYPILVSYANKNNSPFIEINAFLDFLGKYAKKLSEEEPGWRKWLIDTPVKFWTEMSTLVESDMCELLTDTDDGRIYMPYFYLEVLKKSYLKAEEDAHLPFPCEESLKITLPENQTKLLSSEFDMVTYLERPQTQDVPIIKINFHEECGSALVLASMIPRRITEVAILKLRNYLRKSGNMEYAIHKLAPQLPGKDTYLQEYINQILLRPLECYNAIQEGGEFAILFWAHFSILIKNDVRKKQELLSEDIAAFQSMSIIEGVCEYFKSLAVKKREADLAFKSLEKHLSKPPYLYSIDKILKFTNQKGVLLLGQYSQKDLETWLREKTTKSVDNQLPELLIVNSSPDGHLYLLKDKMLALCSKLLAEGRIKVKEEITKHWRKLLLEFRREPAMENDDEFEKALVKITGKLCPTLTIILDDPKLYLVYDEMEHNESGVPPTIKFFNKGQLLPLSVLLFIRRKEILMDAKLVLPFWYSLPIITPIIAFFLSISRKKKVVKLHTDSIVDEEHGSVVGKDHAREIRETAGELEFIMVPSGFTLDSYLEDLESRWSRLIDQQARENLVEDVNSLIRDNLRRNLKLQKNYMFNRDVIHQMAVNIITRTPTLAVLSGREFLILYAEFYLIKLLQNIK